MSFFDPKYMAIVKDARFRLRVREEKVRSTHDLIVVSTFGLEKSERRSLRERYLAEFSEGYISFPVKEGSKHLIIRFRRRIEHFSRILFDWIPGFRRRRYGLPSSRARTLEIILRLSEIEQANLKTYLAHIWWRRFRTIGKFDMRGHQYTTGHLNRNTTLEGGHNCTTWITTAPLGEKGEALMELLGADRALEIGTNPGWWMNWLLVAAPADRLAQIIVWTPEPLEKALERIKSGESLEWNFNRL